MKNVMHRSAREVLDDDLRESEEGPIEADLSRNYLQDLVVLTGHGVSRGHDGLRQLGELLRKEPPDSSFEYQTALVDGEMGFLEWTGDSAKACVDDGADSYLIRKVQIVAQTIRYTVVPLPATPDVRRRTDG